MKKPGICLNILAVLALGFLAACSPGGSTPGRQNCSYGGVVCVSLNMAKTFAMGDPLPLQITVTSSKDFSDLSITLDTGSEITLDGPQSWETFISNPTVEPGVAFWNFSIKAGQTISFNRVLHFPLKEGYFHVIVNVVNTGRIIDAIYNFNVMLEKSGGQIFLSNTPIPNRVLQHPTDAVYGPGTPWPTFVIEPTKPWMTADTSLITKLAPTQISPLVATATPTMPPYPPPSSPSPSPTSRPYP
jgi:hypothetical protein